ncbi:vacuolar cation/proton exchanger 3 [Selaginella moellendorffii]|uniref:vacuolar cation/proton exchanger 3 n=1 Tax=Selaginella moellendorffii TaxID=88036 RepID=UPI000D1C5FC9|nr:vacuolar cation/proton exchanger 3 [Selaginella moellendorffii]|eukprot:XP_002986504.2 vacuolar cation/proton exchanger 3 [Selaginella moellendorffii]
MDSGNRDDRLGEPQIVNGFRPHCAKAMNEANGEMEMRTISLDEELGTEKIEKKRLISEVSEHCELDLTYAQRRRPWYKHFARGAKEVLLGSKLCCLLPLVPISIVLANLKSGMGWVFLISLLGIAPLAERLGFVTEQLAFHTSSTVGGLLNATFGNATEMIISIFALRNGMIRVVQLSLLGSILSNMLLVLGCAFFMGGLAFPHKDQRFNKASAVVSSGLLLMAVLGLLFPAVLHSTHTELHDGKSELSLSRFTSCIMLMAYASYLFFQLKSHRKLYENEQETGDNESEAEESVMGFWEANGWLAILTVFISVLSEYLVDAIQGAADSWNIPVAFISVIILPIVGNAAEHASAIMFALKDKLDISLGVAIGSSTQISMFVIPFCVVMGWIMGKPMDLDFQLFETATLFITVLVVAFMLQEGTSNYFKGLMLLFCYLIVAASFFVHVDQPQHGNT